MDPVLGVILGAIFSGGISFYIAARKMSGKVATSEATELWAESKSIREWSTDRITTLNAIVLQLETRIQSVEEQKLSMGLKNIDLMEVIAGLQAELVGCRLAVQTLTSKLDTSEERVDVLEEGMRRRRDDPR